MEEKYNCSFYKDLMDEQCNIITKNDTILNIPTTALKKDIKKKKKKNRKKNRYG